MLYNIILHLATCTCITIVYSQSIVIDHSNLLFVVTPCKPSTLSTYMYALYTYMYALYGHVSAEDRRVGLINKLHHKKIMCHSYTGRLIGPPPPACGAYTSSIMDTKLNSLYQTTMPLNYTVICLNCKMILCNFRLLILECQRSDI